MLIVSGTLRVAPTDVVAFTADLEPLIASTQLREGAIFYHTVLLDEDTGEFLVSERWRDQAALGAHLNADDTLAFVARWQGRMESDVRMYDATNERPLTAE